MLTRDWPHPYDRELAVHPSAHVRAAKYWPPVRRIDGVRGDRNLVCSCPPPEAFAADTTDAADARVAVGVPPSAGADALVAVAP